MFYASKSPTANLYECVVVLSFLWGCQGVDVDLDHTTCPYAVSRSPNIVFFVCGVCTLVCRSTYASKYLDTMQGDELKAYDVILNDHDNEWDMFYWLTGQSPLPEYLEQNKVMQELVEYTRNRSKEVRVSMPPLNHE
eukprot:m.180912 g.180912  ORF g.180912 m.180912 type:complete len:137 (-) comp14660_c2_seq1:2344-2754(-)